MLNILILWFIFAFLSIGIIGINYIYAKKIINKPWDIKKDVNYTPSVSIIVPTYNECEIINYKLKNLKIIEYPTNLTQIIFIDSQSSDSTVTLIKTFTKDHPKLNISIIEEKERKGKSFALNKALKICDGDVVVVSDADCFWPPNILVKSLPYLGDPTVGAISGPKKLLNSISSWVTRSEDQYLKSMNIGKLADSKKSSTVFFEGGFSAYKKEVIDSFDPYDTGSDDCGTVIKLLENNYRAIMITEGEFFTTFPDNLRGKLDIKIRRASQLISIYKNYFNLLLKNKIKIGKYIVLKNLIFFFISPLMFLFCIITSVYLLIKFPIFNLVLLLLLFPKARYYLIEVIFNYSILLYSILMNISNNKFNIWKKSRDRYLLSESMLVSKRLI
ncbi:MAG: glycosyltransferase [Candidatus Hodarchaeales archaeon]